MNLYIITLKKYLSDNRRHLSTCLVGLLALALGLGLLSGRSDAEASLGAFNIFLAMSVFIFVTTSLMFREMKNPRGRIATLMTPASTWTKFIARWTVYVPLQAILIIIAFELFEATRVFTFSLFHGGASTEWFDFNITNDYHNGLIIAFGITCLLALQSLFGFGAILWPKRSPLKTYILLWVVLTVMAMTRLFSVNNFMWMQNLTPEGVLSWGIATFCVITVILWSLAYMRLRESDVIDRLF